MHPDILYILLFHTYFHLSILTVTASVVSHYRAIQFYYHYNSLPYILSLAPAFEHEAYDDEIHWDGNTIDRNGGKRLWHTDSKEHIQEGHLQQIVEEMGTTEAESILRRSLLLEGEARRHIVIEDKADEITCGERHTRIDHVHEREVNTVVYHCRQTAGDDEAEDFLSCIAVYHISLYLSE